MEMFCHQCQETMKNAASPSRVVFRPPISYKSEHRHPILDGFTAQKKALTAEIDKPARYDLILALHNPQNPCCPSHSSRTNMCQT